MARNYRVRNASSALVASARQLRGAETPSEAILWNAIRNKRAFPMRVRRQHGVGQYVLDFWIPEARLAIELDGAVHDSEEAQAQDHARTEYLQAYGITVIRFRNHQVLYELDRVIAEIARAIAQRPSG